MGDVVSRYFPDWLALTDKNSLRTYFVGESTLYLDEHLRLWWKPVLSWSGFIIVLVCTAFCINVVMRKQWIEIERLSYPIIELPQQMATKGFFRNRLMWLERSRWRYGYRQRAALLVSIHPRTWWRFSLTCAPILLRNRGMLSVGRPSRSSPFAVGMAYFMPLDLSFTFWFFYVFWKIEMIMGVFLDFNRSPTSLYLGAVVWRLCRRTDSGVLECAPSYTKCADRRMAWRQSV